MILLKDLKQGFGNRELFRGKNIKIESGINYLIGTNGTGKTTLLKLMVGILKPQKGEIKYDDKSIEEALDTIGIVFDEPCFFPYLTGLENLLYFNQNARIKVDENFIKSLYHTWNIGAEDIRYGQYSLGMKKKLSIVLSLMRNPSYWLLDEPFNGLDMETQHMLKLKMTEMKKLGKTVILSSHNMNDHIDIADHILALCHKELKYYPNVSRNLGVLGENISVEKIINELEGKNGSGRV